MSNFSETGASPFRRPSAVQQWRSQPEWSEAKVGPSESGGVPRIDRVDLEDRAGGYERAVKHSGSTPLVGVGQAPKCPPNGISGRK